MNPGKSFELTLLSPEIGNLTKELSETILDSVLEDGILKDIPIISSVVSGFKIYSSIKERIYIKKLYKFLYELQSISHHERELFLQSFTKEEDKTDFFEKLLFLIDRQDDVYKSTIVGKLFAKVILEKISTDDFLRITIIIDRVYSKDLEYFKKESWKNLTPEKSYSSFHSSYNETINNNLEYVGLLISEKEAPQVPEYVGGPPKSRAKYRLSQIGKILFKNGF